MKCTKGYLFRIEVAASRAGPTSLAIVHLSCHGAENRRSVKRLVEFAQKKGAKAIIVPRTAGAAFGVWSRLHISSALPAQSSRVGQFARFDDSTLKHGDESLAILQNSNIA